MVEEPYYKSVGHDGEFCGQNDEEGDLSKSVCEGMYADKCNDVTQLCAALRAVYAIAGEDDNVRKIVEDAINSHGGPNV